MYTFTVCTVNLFVGAVKRHPDKVLADIGRYLKEANYVVMQETGEAEEILKRAARKYDVFTFKGWGLGGQASTAVVSKRKPVKSKSIFLTKPTFVGKRGAGPDTTKAKWYQTCLFRIYGRSIWIGTIHTSPSIYIRIRMLLALEQTTDTAEATTTFKGLKIVGGDYNSEPDSKVRRPLVREGLVSSQNNLGWIDTMGKRCIDDQHYTRVWKRLNKRLRAVKHWTREGSTDHRAYFVTYQVKPTWRWLTRKKLTGKSD